MVWSKTGSAPPVKARRVQSAGKIMLSLFWDCKGPLLIDFLPHKQTVNGDYYATLMGQLHDQVVEKRRGNLTRGVMLLHDNAPVHTAKVAQAAIRRARFTQLEHPPYSPDLAPSDFHLFPNLKKFLRGMHFNDDDHLQSCVRDWLFDQPETFYRRGIESLIDRCHKCIANNGSYVEKT